MPLPPPRPSGSCARRGSVHGDAIHKGTIRVVSGAPRAPSRRRGTRFDRGQATETSSPSPRGAAQPLRHAARGGALPGAAGPSSRGRTASTQEASSRFRILAETRADSARHGDPSRAAARDHEGHRRSDGLRPRHVAPDASSLPWIVQPRVSVTDDCPEPGRHGGHPVRFLTRSSSRRDTVSEAPEPHERKLVMTRRSWHHLERWGPGLMRAERALRSRRAHRLAESRPRAPRGSRVIDELPPRCGFWRPSRGEDRGARRGRARVKESDRVAT